MGNEKMELRHWWKYSDEGNTERRNNGKVSRLKDVS